MLQSTTLYASISPERARRFVKRIESEYAENLFYALSQNNFKFISDRKTSPEIAKIVDEQQTTCKEVVVGLCQLQKAQIPDDVQNKIFDICKTLLPLTLKYGYVEESVDFLRIMRHPNLVGDNAQWNPERVFKMISATYGKRKLLGDTDRMKYNNRAFIDDINKGRFGKQEKSPAEVIETLKYCYKNPDEVISQNTDRDLTGA